MKLSIHQPAYLPWMGYFDKIALTDHHVFLDSVQFEKNSFSNRNRIKTQNGALWLTIPVKLKGHSSSTLSSTQIDNSQNWKARHLKSIWMNYKRAPRFDSCYPKLEKLFSTQHDLLSELCYEQLLFWLKELEIRVSVTRSSTLGISSQKSELILDLCKHFHSTQYLSGELGKNYLLEEDFAAAGIEIQYQKFVTAHYPQLHGEFIPNLSVLDQWMNSENPNLNTRSTQNEITTEKGARSCRTP